MTTYIDPKAPFVEKLSTDFGLKVAKKIADEWFDGKVLTSGSRCEFSTRANYIINKRRFVRNEVDIKRFKDRLSKSKTDLQFLNLNFKTKNIAKKFCNTVINGISDKNYILDIVPMDKVTARMKKEKEFEYRANMQSKDMMGVLSEQLGFDVSNAEMTPESEEELGIWLETKDRPKIKITEEILIHFIKESNDWDTVEYQLRKDIVEIGIAVCRVFIDKQNGVCISYIDPENYVHSYNHNSPNFKDKYYEGVVESITISQLIREFNPSKEQLENICKVYHLEDKYQQNDKSFYNHKVQLLRFAYKTHKPQIFKQKKRKGRVVKLTKKDENFKAPKVDDVGTLEQIFDTWLEGNFVLGTDVLLDWKECENIYDDVMNKAVSPYITFATDIYRNQLKSFTDEIEEFSDELNFIALKIQHLTSELKPDLTVINQDALAEIEIAGHIKQGAWEVALDLLTTRGIVVERTVDMGDDGGVQRLHTAKPYATQQGSSISILLNQWAFYYNQLRENTGINPARDGSLSQNALVGTSQMMQLSSNMVTKNLADTALNMNRKICETISSRIHSIFFYKEAEHLRKLYYDIVGKQLVDAIEILKDRHLHEFGFVFRMIPSQEDIQQFREDLSVALQNGMVNVVTKSEAEYIYATNPELARQFLNYSIRKEEKRKMEEQMSLAKNKSENDAMASQMRVQLETEAFQQKQQIELEMYKQKKMIDLEYQQKLLEIQAPVRQEEFGYDMELERAKVQSKLFMENDKEDRKDMRTEKQATQQSKMIEQRKSNGGAINFEEKNNHPLNI